MPLEAGLMDQEIVLQTATASQSESGEETFEWETAKAITIWAQWLPAGTREAWQAQQRLGSYIDGVFRIYDLSPRPAPDNTRILFDDRVFDTKPYIEIGRGEGLDIPVVARSAGE